MEPAKVISRTLASRTPADAVKRRQSLFEQASEVAFRAVQAISQGQEHQARVAVDELRFLKRLIRNGEPLQSGPEDISSASPLALQLMRLAFDAVSQSDAVIAQWVYQNQLDLVCSTTETDPQAWQRLIDATVSDAWSFETDIFLVVGAAPAALIDALRERGQRRIVVYGLCSLVAKPGTELLVSDDLAAVTSFIRSLKKPLPKAYATMIMCDAVADAADAADAAAEDTPAKGTERAALQEQVHKALMSNWMDSNTIRYFAQRWVQQGVANIPAIAHHENLHALDGKFRDRPAILIAPGPSLDKNIGLLHEAKDRAVLIAPLQSLRRLYKAGIKPDFIMVLDAADLTTEPLDFFTDVPDDFLTTLVVAVNCHPNVIRRFQRVYFFSGGGPLDRWVQDIVPQPLITLDASSVAITGLLLAHHWGCNPITLVGQDLALTGNRRYAGDAQLNNAPQLMTLPGYYGGTVQSPSDYFLFHHQFEKIAEKIALLSPETQLFNATEGGAFIQGFAHEPLHTLLEQYVMNLPTQPVVNLLIGVQNPAASRMKVARIRLQKTRKVLEDLQQQVRQLVRLSQQPRPQAATLRKLSDKEQLLRKTLKQIQGFTRIYQDDIDQAVAAAKQAKSLHDNLVASQALYQVVADSCQFFYPLVEDALTALQAIDSTHTSAEAGQQEVALLA